MLALVALQDPRKVVIWLLGLALVYTGLVFTGVTYTREFGSVAPLWPATGLLLGVLLRFPDYWRPIITVCAPGLLLANTIAGGDTLLVAMGLVVANMLSVLPALWVLHQRHYLPFVLNGLSPLLVLGVIILLAPLPGAIWGAGVIRLAYATPFAEILRLWWLSDVMGCIVLTPLVLAWPPWLPPQRTRHFWIEGASLLILTALITYLAFGLERLVLPHLVMPLLLWAALRFGLVGTALAGVVVTAISLTLTVRGITPLSDLHTPLAERILELQLFLCALLAPTLLVAADFMDRQTALAASSLSEARFRDFADTAADIFWEVDAQLRFCYISGRFEKVLGINPTEMLGKPLDTLLRRGEAQDTAESSPGESLPTLDPDRHQGHRDRQFRFTRPDGLVRVLRDSARPVLGKQGEFLGYRGAITDITEAHQMHEQIAFQATHDGLTGLPNRTLYRTLLREHLARAKRYGDLIGVLFLDLDGFKPVNDSLGHAVGDLLLQTVAKRLKDGIREADTVARLGGDEFVVLLTDLPEARGAAEVARKLVDILATPYRVPTVQQPLHLSTSIGIALYPQDGDDVDTLLKHADIAMYQVKMQGRNGYRFFSHEMHTRTLSDLTLSNELHQALSRDEFVLYYQPRVALDDGHLLGVEALVRWQHPQRGLLSPGDFIPLAELTGVIDPLSRWVVQRACAQGREWLAQGLPAFQIAVNLSAQQFRERDLPQLIAHARGNTADPHLALEVELTESMVMRNPTQALEVMQELKHMGVQVAIDDFGTGYSSLAQLRRFPLDCLKIDRSFVEQLPGEMEDQAIIEAIVALAKSLKLHLVAEGVETQAQWDCLRRLGCDEGQGYLFGRPMSADDLVLWLGRQNTRRSQSAD